MYIDPYYPTYPEIGDFPSDYYNRQWNQRPKIITVTDGSRGGLLSAEKKPWSWENTRQKNPYFHYEIPGFGPNDVEVEIVGEQLVVTILTTEKFDIPDIDKLDLTSAKATVENGVLVVEFKKKAIPVIKVEVN